MTAFQIIDGYADRLSGCRRRRSPVLVVMIGAPGAGKTTHAMWISRLLDAPRIATDDIKALFRVQDETFSIIELFNIQRRILELGMARRCNLIADSNCDRFIYQSILESLAREYGYKTIYCVCLASPHLLADRVRIRASLKGAIATISTADLETIVAGLEIPDQAIRLDTSRPRILTRLMLALSLLGKILVIRS